MKSGLFRVLSMTCSPAALVSVVMAAESAAQLGPIVYHTASGYELYLPSEMRQPLVGAVPGFETWPLSHYSADARFIYVFTARQAPWAVVGDFNGDGGPDAIVDGHDSTKAYELCLLSDAGGYRVLVLRSWLLSDSDLESGTVLLFSSPGRQGTNFSDEEFTIVADGFTRYFVDKAGTLYYWNGDGFEEFATSD